jgi:hypothetical protein
MPSARFRKATCVRFEVSLASGGSESGSGECVSGANDPNLGRWTQQDVIGGFSTNPSIMNRYAYAGCNPVNLPIQRAYMT